MLARAMPYFLRQEETLDAAGLAELQRRKLGALLEAVLRSNGFYQTKLAAYEFHAKTDRIDRLPFTTRTELQDDQCRWPPFGTNLTYEVSRYNRFHQTSGTAGTPLRWLDTPESWEWCKRCWSIVFRAAGLLLEDRVVFPFSFGPFLGFWSAFDAAAALGNLCLPAGGMTTTARLHYLLDHKATVVCCTPTYALRMAEVAAAEDIDLRNSAIRMLIVAGEPGGGIQAVRARIESAWNARVIDHAGMTEAGPWGVECEESPGGMHVIESEFLAEAINPASGTVVPEGELGELVLTNLGRTGSPLIRYRTGDQVRLRRGLCPCGRSFARLEGGILGRTDDMLIIRGNNVFPSAIEAVLREFPEIVEYRLSVQSVGNLADLRIEIEVAPGADGTGLAERAAAAIRDRLHFRPEVKTAPSGSLPRFEMKARRVQRDHT